MAPARNRRVPMTLLALQLEDPPPAAGGGLGVLPFPRTLRVYFEPK